jgi:hypothetical protein
MALAASADVLDGAAKYPLMDLVPGTGGHLGVYTSLTYCVGCLLCYNQVHGWP